jgi:hypothetical protein
MEFQYLKVCNKTTRFSTRNSKLYHCTSYMILNPPFPFWSSKWQVPKHYLLNTRLYIKCAGMFVRYLYIKFSATVSYQAFLSERSKIQILHGCHVFRNIKKITQIFVVWWHNHHVPGTIVANWKHMSDVL